MGSSVSLLSRSAIAQLAEADGEVLADNPSGNEKAETTEVKRSGSTPEPTTLDLGALLNSIERSAPGDLLGRTADSSSPIATEAGVLPTVTEMRSPQFSASLASDANSETIAQASPNKLTLERFRELISAPAVESAPEETTSTTQVDVEDRTEQIAQTEDDLPTLEEADPVPPLGAPPVEETPPTAAPNEPIPNEPGTGPAPNDLIPDSRIDPPDVIQPLPDSSPVEGPAPELGDLPDILFADPNPLNLPATEEGVEIERNPVVTLEQAVELAYRNSPVLQAAILQLEQADAAIEQARAANLPTLSTTAGITSQERDAVSGGINPFTGAEIPGEDSGIDTALSGSLRVEYDLLTGGSRRATIRQAELQRDNAALTVETQQEQLRLATANNYYALQEAGEQIRIQRSFLEEAERNLRDSRLRQEVGVGTRFDTLRAEVQFANARQQVIQAQGQQRIARRDIARLLNLPPNSGLQTTPVSVAESWPLTLEESILLAYNNRAELEQQLLEADINEQQRQIALASVRPRLGLFADYSLQSLLNDGADDIEDNYSFGATFNWLLFDGGAARASARQQEIASQIAEEQFSDSSDQIRFDVEEAFFNLETNQENITTSRIAVSQAEEALDLANLRLQAGVGTQLDVLSAQSELTQAQANNISAILDYNRALAAMQRAVSNVTVE